MANDSDARERARRRLRLLQARAGQLGKFPAAAVAERPAIPRGMPGAVGMPQPMTTPTEMPVGGAVPITAREMFLRSSPHAGPPAERRAYQSRLSDIAAERRRAAGVGERAATGAAERAQSQRETETRYGTPKQRAKEARLEREKEIKVAELGASTDVAVQQLRNLGSELTQTMRTEADRTTFTETMQKLSAQQEATQENLRLQGKFPGTPEYDAAINATINTAIAESGIKSEAQIRALRIGAGLGMIQDRYKAEIKEAGIEPGTTGWGPFKKELPSHPVPEVPAVPSAAELAAPEIPTEAAGLPAAPEAPSTQYDLDRSGAVEPGERERAEGLARQIIGTFEALPPEQKTAAQTSPKYIWAKAILGQMKTSARTAAERLVPTR